jgi:hypothetical protein
MLWLFPHKLHRLHNYEKEAKARELLGVVGKLWDVVSQQRWQIFILRFSWSSSACCWAFSSSQVIGLDTDEGFCPIALARLRVRWLGREVSGGGGYSPSGPAAPCWAMQAFPDAQQIAASNRPERMFMGTPSANSRAANYAAGHAIPCPGGLIRPAPGRDQQKSRMLMSMGVECEGSVRFWKSKARRSTSKGQNAPASNWSAVLIPWGGRRMSQVLNGRPFLAQALFQIPALEVWEIGFKQPSISTDVAVMGAQTGDFLVGHGASIWIKEF